MAQITFTNTGGIQTSGDSYSAGNFELEENKVLNLRNTSPYFTNLKSYHIYLILKYSNKRNNIQKLHTQP